MTSRVHPRSALEAAVADAIYEGLSPTALVAIARRRGVARDDFTTFALGLAAELIFRDLVVAGDVVDGRHVAWDLPAASAVQRISLDWFALGDETPLPGQLFWLELTAAGHEMLRELADRDSDDDERL